MDQPVTTSKRFAISFFFGFVLMCLGVITLHVLGNPDQLFPSPFVPAHSQRSWKSRHLQTLLDQGKSPQVVVLGSSRMRQVSPKQIEAITNLRTFNYAVGGASCVESLAQLKSLLRRGIKPQMLVVGVDERALLGLYDAHLGRATEDPYIFRELPVKEKARHAWHALIDIDFTHTWAAVRNLMHGPPELTERPPVLEYFVCDDGYMVNVHHTLGRVEKPQTPAQLRDRLIGGKKPWLRHTRSVYSMASIDSDQLKAITDIIKLCHGKQIQLKIISTPLYPEFENAVVTVSLKKRIDSAMTKIKTACRANSAEFHDFRNIKSFEGQPLEFWDPWHVTPANMQRMINRTFGQSANAKQAGVPDDIELIRHPPDVTSINVW